MPKIVDRDARRRLIVDALLQVAERDGLEAATSRAIAAELGVATSSLWHYFPNFDAILARAFDAVIARNEERIRARTTGLSGLGALRATMEEVLPLDAVTQAEARLVVSFWGRIAVIESLAASVQAVDLAWRSMLTHRLREATLEQQIADDAPLDAIVDLLMSVVSGQQVVWVTSGTVVEVDRQRRLLAMILRPYLVSDTSVDRTQRIARAHDLSERSEVG